MLAAFFLVLVMTSLFGGIAGQPTCPGYGDLLVGQIGNAPNQFLIAKNLSLAQAPYQLQICQVGGSAAGFSELNIGTVDALTLTTDNSVYRELNGLQSLTLLAALDNNFGHVVLATNGHTSFASLKGANIAVDAAVSGFVNEFEAIAEANGLNTSMYNLVIVGGTPVRYQAILKGSFVNAAGVTVPIDATVLTPPYNILYQTAASTSPVYNLANVTDYIAPISGASVTIGPHLATNATKQAAMVQFLTAVVLGNYVYQNPANEAYLTAFFQQVNGFTDKQAVEYYQLLTNPINGIETIQPNLYYNTLNLLNEAYTRQRLGGFTNAEQNFTNLLSNGPGQFIDYTLLSQAVTAAQAKATVSTNAPASFTNITCFPNFGLANLVIHKAAATVSSYASGGCSGAPTATVAGCSSTDPTASPSQCAYNAATDALTVTLSTPANNLVGTRVYTVIYGVSDICGFGATIKQTITVEVPHTRQVQQSSICPPSLL